MLSANRAAGSFALFSYIFCGFVVRTKCPLLQKEEVLLVGGDQMSSHILRYVALHPAVTLSTYARFVFQAEVVQCQKAQLQQLLRRSSPICVWLKNSQISPRVAERRHIHNVRMLLEKKYM